MNLTPSAEAINEDFLCVMKYNSVLGKVELSYLRIEKLLQKEFLYFEQICQSELTSLDGIIEHLSKDTGLPKLVGHYSYCQDVAVPYQSVIVSKAEIIAEQIRTHYKILVLNAKNNPEKHNLSKSVREYKMYLINNYRRWVKAYSIQATYELCNQDKSVLAYSHRLRGWSNPVYQLTKNFSVEIKTNFGYGSVSYFFSKLKFKNIDVTPFSEWVDYEHSNFSEIIRYTQRYYVNNKQWLDAMIFCQNACNLSLSDEINFVKIYIIDECEKMILGLEDILSKENLQFKNRDNKIYSFDKTGRLLLEFRGEKISGALDFISKILVLNSIFDVTNIIARIEAYNKFIQPILEKEILIIENELSSLVFKISVLKPKFLLLKNKNESYESKRKKLIAETEVNSKILYNRDFELKFKEKYPLYESFLEEFQNVSREYSITSQLLENTKKIYDSISGYNEKIVSFFEKQKVIVW